MGQLRFMGGAENIFTRTRGRASWGRRDRAARPQDKALRGAARGQPGRRAPPLPGWLRWAHVPVPVIDGLVSKHCCFSVLRTDQE